MISLLKILFLITSLSHRYRDFHSGKIGADHRGSIRQSKLRELRDIQSIQDRGGSQGSSYHVVPGVHTKDCWGSQWNIALARWYECRNGGTKEERDIGQMWTSAEQETCRVSVGVHHQAQSRWDDWEVQSSAGCKRLYLDLRNWLFIDFLISRQNWHDQGLVLYRCKSRMAT